MVDALRPDDDLGFDSDKGEPREEALGPEDDMGFISSVEEEEPVGVRSQRANYYWGTPPDIEVVEEPKEEGPSLISQMDMRGKFGLRVSAFLCFVLFVLVMISAGNPELMVYWLYPLVALLVLSIFHLVVAVMILGGLSSVLLVQYVLVSLFWDIPILMVSVPLHLLSQLFSREE